MTWTTDGHDGAGIVERDFAVHSASSGEQVPGVYRRSADGEHDRLVLLGHGGTSDRKADYIVHLARLLAERGIATMAIDGPGHGERATFEFKRTSDDFDVAWNGGGGTDGMLGDWRTALDFVESEFGERPTGWWGLSMGTMMGLPVAATDERIRLAVLGLMGSWGPNAADLERLAPQLSCPLRFLVQWDDEIVPRDRCLDLFGMIGSERKTLHANPGAHSAVPMFEVTASADYLDEYLR